MTLVSTTEVEDGPDNDDVEGKRVFANKTSPYTPLPTGIEFF
jgi:hypothetical protein